MAGSNSRWQGPTFGCCLLALMPLVTACGEDCNAPPILVYALSVQVVDAASSEPICDAVVTIEHTGRTETLPASNCGHAGGASGGNYRVTVRREGYRDDVSTVVVEENECSVPKTKRVEVALDPT